MFVKRDVIRDRNGKILGWVETDHLGNKVAKSFYGRILGRYTKMNNITKDFYGKIVAIGDATVGLLYRK